MASLVSLEVVVCAQKVDHQRVIRLIHAWASFDADSYVLIKHVFNAFRRYHIQFQTLCT
jgi:hypothetical protein